MTQPSFEAEAGSAETIGISKRDVLVFLFKWKGSIIGWTLFTVAMVTMLTYLLAPVYPASSKVVVERNRAPTLRSTYAHDGLESIEAMNNEVAIIKSRPVMSVVVDELEPHKRPRGQSALSNFIQSTKTTLAEIGLINNLEPREDWIDRLNRLVEALPGVNSNVLEISYSDEDPQWAAKIVNAVTSQYIKHHLAVYSSQGVTDFYATQVAQAQAELAQLRAAAQDYKRDASISAVTDRKSQLVRQLANLGTDLITARNERNNLLNRFEPGHPEIQLTNDRIAGINATQKSIQEELTTLERQESEIAAMDMRILNQANTLAELQDGYEQARLNAASNAEIINVRLIEYAPVPVKPRFTRLLLIVLSLPLGLGLALSIAMLRQYLDHRADEPGAAEAALQLPCFGSVPELDRNDPALA